MSPRIIGGILITVLLAACANKANPTSDVAVAQGSPTPTTGDEYAAELGLILHRYDPSMDLGNSGGDITLNGQPLEGCEKPADGTSVSMAILDNGHLYCYRWEDELEAWIISERLQGQVPTDEEIAAREEELSRG